MSRGFGAIQRAVLDALSDKLIITLSTLDLAHIVNGGVRSRSMIASVHRALRTLEAAGKVVRLDGRWALASRQREARSYRYRQQPESPVQQRNERLKLISKILGMLGSSQDGEVLAAAKRAEAKRVELGLSWDDIILGDSCSII
ncbi:hypothetical protein Nwi_1972 [Nitrobacter winogradskyi Nb-255]|uniref:Uncharacterized protein n=1 Tax=Nitrobacter winogradskyi (strain ATCC 25391 / DSM 10237 / CIP 104748 / NCIMB 11846 / Nb-255) TaxID=323098 RepID=Q3SR60_NITWN|nr:hypothetical protein [Nitrobacter winogradskyi]ABA05231.1 hypothetical protein Nwi_1972 [Nitrobacter winogradskyi Nb-255]